MIRAIKKVTVILLAFCMAVSAVPLSVQASVSGRDAYYLAQLRPNPMPRVRESYPAKLIVNSWLRDSPQARLEFRGTCGINAEVPDEELLRMMKETVNQLDGYKTLDDVINDKQLISELTEKLKFTDEDMQEIFENWRKMLGIDEVWDILQGKLPELDEADGVNAIIDAAGGDIPLIPSSPGVGTVVDTVFIAFDQYQKDVEKWDNIVKLHNTKRRFSNFNNLLGGKIRDYLRENGNWTISIKSQDRADMTFLWVPGNKQIWTADIELKKISGGNFNSAAGTYTGRFELRVDTDLSAFDSRYDDSWVDWLHDNQGIEARVHQVKPPFMSDTKWVSASNTGSRSEARYAYEIPDCTLNLALPVGVLRTFFEIPISDIDVFLTEYTHRVDRTIVLNGDDDSASYTYTHQIIMDDDITAVSGYTEVIPKGSGVAPWDSSNTDSWSHVEALDTHLSMTLIIDMLGK